MFCNKRHPNISQPTISKHLKTDEKNMFKLKIDVLMSRIEAMKVKIAQLDLMDAENLKKKELFIAKMQSEGAKFWHGELKRGNIVRNGIEYLFEIETDEYIREEIKIAYEWTEESKFDRFLKLSKNAMAN